MCHSVCAKSKPHRWVSPQISRLSLMIKLRLYSRPLPHSKPDNGARSTVIIIEGNLLPNFQNYIRYTQSLCRSHIETRVCPYELHAAPSPSPRSMPAPLSLSIFFSRSTSRSELYHTIPTLRPPTPCVTCYDSYALRFTVCVIRADDTPQCSLGHPIIPTPPPYQRIELPPSLICATLRRYV